MSLSQHEEWRGHRELGGRVRANEFTWRGMVWNDALSNLSTAKETWAGKSKTLKADGEPGHRNHCRPA